MLGGGVLKEGFMRVEGAGVSSVRVQGAQAEERRDPLRKGRGGGAGTPLVWMTERVSAAVGDAMVGG